MLRPGSCGGDRWRTRLGAVWFSALLLFVPVLHAQPVPWNWALSIRGNLVTTSRVYYHPEATVPEIRNAYTGFDRLTGAGIEFRYALTDAGFYLTLSSDLITREQSGTGTIFDSSQARLFRAPETEGIRFIPVELGIRSYIPLGLERLRLSMGGGLGLYSAYRTYRIAGVSMVQTATPTTAGIHIGIGCEYRVWQPVVVCAEVKFRDPEVTSESRFERFSTVFNGQTIRFPQNVFRTKVNVDGMTLSLGVLMEW